MTYWEASASGRVTGASSRWLRRVWGSSFLGKGSAAVGAGVRAGLAGSVLLSLEGGRSRSFGLESASLTLRVFTVLYVVLVRALGESFLGRTARRLGRGASSSVILPLAGTFKVVAGAVGLPYQPEYLLMVLAGFAWVDWGARHTLGGFAGAWDEMFLLFSFGCLLFAVFVARRWDLRGVPILAPLAVMIVAALGSIVVDRLSPELAVYAVRVTFEPMLFYFLGFLLPRDRRIIRWVVIIFLAASVLLALHGVFQYATHAPMPARWIDTHEKTLGTRAYSIIENPNGLGAFLLMGALLASGLALAPALPRRQRWLVAGVALVLSAGIAVTFSRGAWIALAAGALALTALVRPRLLLAVVAAGVAVALFAPRAFVERVTFVFSSEYLAKSATAGRLLMWNRALHLIIEHPWWGIGLGTFGGSTAIQFNYSRLWVDSFYLQMGAEGGLILLLAFLWLLVRAGKGLLLAHREQTDPFLRAMTAGVFAAFIAVVIANATAGVWETVAVGAGFWFLVGLASVPVDPAFRLPRVGRLEIVARHGLVVEEDAALASPSGGEARR